ncbi:hypothetical protein QYF61_003193, partial [Mycteria americana]
MIPLSKFEDDTKLGGVADTPEGQGPRLAGEKWADRNLKKFNKGKCKLLNRGRNNPSTSTGWGLTGLDMSSSGKDLGVLLDNKLTTSQQHLMVLPTLPGHCCSLLVSLLSLTIMLYGISTLPMATRDTRTFLAITFSLTLNKKGLILPVNVHRTMTDFEVRMSPHESSLKRRAQVRWCLTGGRRQHRPPHGNGQVLNSEEDILFHKLKHCAFTEEFHTFADVRNHKIAASPRGHSGRIPLFCYEITILLTAGIFEAVKDTGRFCRLPHLCPNGPFFFHNQLKRLNTKRRQTVTPAPSIMEMKPSPGCQIDGDLIIAFSILQRNHCYIQKASTSLHVGEVVLLEWAVTQ